MDVMDVNVPDVMGSDEPERWRQLARRAERLRRGAQRLDRRARRYAVARLALFFGGLLAGILCWRLVAPMMGGVALVAALLVFTGVVVIHNRVEDALRRYRLLGRLVSAQQARLDLDWPRLPPARGRPVPVDHPFGADLDLVGERSLHRLLDLAVTREGGELLRAWLLEEAPDADATRRRQVLARALAPRTLFRDRLLVTAMAATGGAWDGGEAARWLAGRPATPLARPRAVALGLLALALGLLFLAGVFAPGLNRAFALGPLVLASLLYLVRRRLVRPHIGGVRALDAALEGPRRVFAYLETSPFGPSPELRALCAPLRDDGARASDALGRVARVTGLATLQESLAWPVINLIAPLDLILAYRLSRDTALLAARLPRWLDVWFELEALSSLANLAYLHPDYAFPDVGGGAWGDNKGGSNGGSNGGGPVFEARALGHPLISAAHKIANSFAIERLGDVALITGSNMAGKSSFLRTLGVNLSLAYAGGPVDAAHLRTGVFRLFTSIAVADSVTEGYSYFYAEVRRLKALLTALERADAPPLFFLVDEIFRGTNNRERLLGGRAYLRALAGGRGVGAVSTHDLGLVELADLLPQITNYHFRDDVVGGQLVFDYTLRPGPAPTTNALKIMQLAGLPVT